MSLFIDVNYVGLLSSRLERFKRKSEYLWNFRCPFCGDSSKSKYKARGYIYRRQSNLFFSCHNCGMSISMGNFLKAIDPELAKQYRYEKYCEQVGPTNTAKPDFSWAAEKPVFKVKPIELPTIASLAEDHSAHKFLVNRKIPKERFDDLYYAFDFREFVYDIFPEYQGSENDRLVPNEERIIIPFFDQNNKLLGFQGRALSNSKVRYITIKLGSEGQKIYGLDRIDFTKKINVVEGPFDSMFLPNSLAVMDGALQRAALAVGNYNFRFIFDNEPFNPQLVKHMKTTIDMGKEIFIWPSHIREKDINDLIKAGHTPSDIMLMIDQNTFSGIKANLQFNLWKQ